MRSSDCAAPGRGTTASRRSGTSGGGVEPGVPIDRRARPTASPSSPNASSTAANSSSTSASPAMTSVAPLGHEGAAMKRAQSSARRGLERGFGAQAEMAVRMIAIQQRASARARRPPARDRAAGASARAAACARARCRRRRDSARSPSRPAARAPGCMNRVSVVSDDDVASGPTSTSRSAP